MADSDKGTESATTAARAAQPTMRLDSSNVTSSYANTCYASSTKEEVVLNFGLNQSWERGQKDMQVQLTNRIILSPYAAKRLVLLLTAVMQQHEARFGPLDVSGGAAPGQPAAESSSEPKLRPVKR
jgi:uncharacterized protein DUF3467